MDTQFVLLCIALLLLLYLLWRKRTVCQHRLPPGPTGHWLYGLLFENWFNYQYFSRQAQQYGEIFSLRVFGLNFVVVNSYEALKEAYANDWLTGRFSTPFIRELSHDGHGLISSEGDLWRTHRRFALSVLRDFGFGKSKIEVSIQKELEFLRDCIGEQSGRAFNPHQAYAKAVSNVINQLVFNERCSEEPEFENIIEQVKLLANIPQSSAVFALLWPMFKKLPGDASGLKKYTASFAKISSWTARKYEEHKLSFDSSNIRDYIDAFLLESSRKNETDYFTSIQLQQTVFDLFVAGLETTSTTLLWATTFLARHRDVQRKVYREIEETIGDSKLPAMGDKAKLRYTDAVLHEIQRFATLVPLGVPHRATETGQIRGYDIPKDSVVVSNLWSVHRSEKLWKDPHNFNPENFLDAEGNLVNSNYMVGFSTGKRVCLGESLARQELFIFLVGLLQQFEFIEDPSRPLPGVEDTNSCVTSRSPLPFLVIARRRDSA